jgi:membrane protease YdiL (CAAX protease family)
MSGKIKTIIGISIGLALMQGIRFAVREAALFFCGRTLLADTIVSAVFMAAVVPAGIIIARRNGISLAVFPEKHRPVYAVSSIIVVALTISAPFITGDKSLLSIISLICMVIITPVFEELIFRGYIWELLEEKFDSRLAVYHNNAVIRGLAPGLYRQRCFQGIAEIAFGGPGFHYADESDYRACFRYRAWSRQA